MDELSPTLPDLGGEIETLIDISFPAHIDQLAMVRQRTKAAAEAAGFDRTTAGDIVLAVDEACANIILHTYCGESDGTIDLSVIRCRGGLRLRLRDYGPPVEQSNVKPRDLEEVKPGGLGTYFINTIMDSSRILPAPAGEGNVLEMIKKGGDSR